MKPDSDRARIEELTAQVRKHEALYRAGTPEITDHEFDQLWDEYVALADKLDLAPDARIDTKPGADHTEGFTTIEHRIPMLSLEKLTPNRRDSNGEAVPIFEQLEAWYARRVQDLERAEGTNIPVVVEPKIDGISASLTYVNGKLERAVTRGDGRRGDDITKQVLSAQAVPATLKGMRGSLEIRGELYWPRAAFDRYNATLTAAGEPTIANPRNGCAGVIKRKDPKGLEAFGITSFLYQLAWSEGVALPTSQYKLLEALAEAGAPVYLSETYLAQDARAAFDYCEAYGAKRGTLEYDIDGMVLKIDERALWKR